MQHILLQNNENKPFTHSRDTQEVSIPYKVAEDHVHHGRPEQGVPALRGEEDVHHLHGRDRHHIEKTHSEVERHVVSQLLTLMDGAPAAQYMAASVRRWTLACPMWSAASRSSASVCPTRRCKMQRTSRMGYTLRARATELVDQFVFAELLTETNVL